MHADLENLCVAIYPTVGQEVSSLLAVLCDENHMPTEHVVAVRCAGESPNLLPVELLKGDNSVFIPLGGRRDFGLEIRMVWKR